MCFGDAAPTKVNAFFAIIFLFCFSCQRAHAWEV